MLLSLLRRAGAWLTQSGPDQDVVPLCVPEWSEAMAKHHAAIWRTVRPYTMTSIERIVALCQCVAYVEKHRIPGDIVECGVWKGGSMMAAALSLLAFESTHRQLYLFDTFTGMTEPALVDVDCEGRSARDLMRQSTPEGDHIRARCLLADVKAALMQTRYPWELLRFVQGPVEKTLPDHAPAQIALLRLDTDWYESTYHELEQLYPRLAEGGILIVDDYGHWQGAKRAVDTYFREQHIDPDLRTIDYTGRLLIKRQGEPARKPSVSHIEVSA